MPTGDDSTFQIIACIVISILCAYGGGRIHQWYKHGMDRDRSFREGFNHGYHALFPHAARGPRPAAGRACDTADLGGEEGNDRADRLIGAITPDRRRLS
jgi:hypothetical protein